MITGWKVVRTGQDSALLALAPDENAYRLFDQLTDAEYEVLAAQVVERPDAWLWIENGATDLEVLSRFTGLRNLKVTSLRLRSWDGIRHVVDSLEHLVVGETTLKGSISIEPIGSATRLRSLYLTGPVRHADVLPRLTQLEELVLRSITISDLGVLVPMRRLRTLRLLLGGTTDLRHLPRLESLEEVELWRIRGLRDVTVLGSLPTVRSLELQSMSAITELPSLGGAMSLRRLVLDTMKGIRDLRPVAEAPALEELLLIGMNQLTPDALEPLVGHPTLRRGIWGLGSFRKNAAAYDRLPLGDPPYGHPAWRMEPAVGGDGSP